MQSPMRTAQAFSGTAAVLAGLLAFAPAAAVGQSPPSSVGEAVFGRRAADGRHAARAPAVARYVADEGPSFVLERTSGRAYLRFDDNDEVHVLRPDSGPRGELIWRNDVGRPVLSASRLGGMTVFTPLRPGGAPVAFASAADALSPAAISPQQLHERLAAASRRTSRMLGRLIIFEAMDIRPGEEPILADAANLASGALVRLAGTARSSAILRRVRQVRLTRGRAAGATLVADTVVVTVNPQQGVAGRPSSERIAIAVVSAR